MIERTLILVKPDGVRRGLVGEVISRFERKGFRIVGLKMLKLSRQKAEELYEPHRGREFFEGLIRFMTSGPIVAMAIEGESAISIARTMIGATSPTEAKPGTIRGDFSLDTRENVVHASDSPRSAERELEVIFSPEEIC
ncbi:nucleoside-diphosphate kinase [Candidatus Poribacteria bacterium]|nr:nucleoside-diphosphate kinase [Candidatus Poribacteria bacterium]